MRPLCVWGLVAAVLGVSRSASAQPEPPKRIRYREGMPIYAGYHLERRSMDGLAVGGVFVTIGGVLIFVAGAEMNDENRFINMGPLMMVWGGVATLGGVAMTIVGMSLTRKYLVRNDVSATLVPIAAREGGGLSLVGTF